MSDVTRILSAIEHGDSWAAEQLLPLVYEELRLLAAQKMSQESPGQTLQPTALVHEAYLRLVGTDAQSWDSRGHFFAAAAEAMRRILIDNARRKKSARHGGECQRVGLSRIPLTTEDSTDDVLALDEALNKLSAEDQQLADVVKLRYFAGLTLEQIASVLNIGRRTVDRYWALGRAWLYQEITRDKNPSD